MDKEILKIWDYLSSLLFAGCLQIIYSRSDYKQKCRYPAGEPAYFLKIFQVWWNNFCRIFIEQDILQFWRARN